MWKVRAVKWPLLLLAGTQSFNKPVLVRPHFDTVVLRDNESIIQDRLGTETRRRGHWLVMQKCGELGSPAASQLPHLIWLPSPILCIAPTVYQILSKWASQPCMYGCKLDYICQRLHSTLQAFLLTGSRTGVADSLSITLKSKPPIEANLYRLFMSCLSAFHIGKKNMWGHGQFQKLC